MWSASLCSMFNLAADVQAHIPLWYILFTHIIAGSSKLLPLLQHKTRTGCYSPFLCDEEWKSPLCGTSRCSRGSAGSVWTRLTCCLPVFPASRECTFSNRFWGKAPGRQLKGEVLVVGFLGWRRRWTNNSSCHPQQHPGIPTEKP